VSDTSSVEEQVLATRRAVGLFDRVDRGLVIVRGSERVRWLDGMVTGDVAALRPGPECSGRYAALLTPKGAIVADLFIFVREDEIWLELSAHVVPAVIERLERYIIADDVELLDGCGHYGELALEGPAASTVLEAASGASPSLQPNALGLVSLADHEIPVAAISESGEPGFRLFVPAAARADVLAALDAAGSTAGMMHAEPAAGEILRIEAGLPRLASELDDMLPDEARLEHAISRDKGCYVGQEIVARVHTRGQVNHLLVGIRFEGDDPPATLGKLETDDRAVGDLTSACRSPEFGPIGLGFVRRKFSAPGQRLTIGGQAATVVALPFAASVLSAKSQKSQPGENH